MATKPDRIIPDANEAGWISVRDSRPTPKTTVLVAVGIGKKRHVEMACSGKTRNSSDWWSVTYNNTLPGWSVTHWQPLPALPPED